MSASLPPDQTRDSSVLAQTYQPIIRGYFGIAAAYYAVMIVSHCIELRGTAFLQLVSAATFAFFIAVAACFTLRKPLAIERLEVLTSIVNLCVMINVLVALNIEYSSAKLVYFIILAVVFAFASVSLRQALVTIGVALGGLFINVATHEPDQLGVYGFIGFAAAITTMSIAFFLRRSIELAVSARQQADIARQTAEARLADAERLGESMRLQSLSDSLTGLPNRRAFFDTLSDCKAQLDSAGNTWVLLLDLDGFKAVNDNHGHVMGDELLKSVSSRLLTHCGEEAHCSRMGGDEFSLILVTDAEAGEVKSWCEQLLERLAEIYLLDDRLIQISGSIGCYQFTSDEPDAKLIQRADFALLHAKKSGKNRVVVFEDEHAEKAAERFRVEQALRIADFSSEIELVFQPQYDLRLEKFVSAEALARWHSPIIGTVAPDTFIRIAEESGLIAKITIAVVDKVIRALERWETPIPISINLSANDLISEPIINEIVALLKSSQLSPALIEFEVTETAMMTDKGRATANLLRLSELGHSIALDDFGTGYSNFTYLRSLPISKLKVDRSFIDDVTDPMTEKVLHSLAGMARTLGVHCLLEGVESELDLLVAKRVGVHSVQGFLFGQPGSEAALHKHFALSGSKKFVAGSR